MKAIVITRFGAPDVLQLRDYPTPTAGEEEVLIEVKASGINRADIFQRKGNYPAPPGVPPDIPGLEAAGIVRSCGPGVTMWKPGDRVCALLAGGGYASFISVKEGQCLPVPDHLSFAEAASLPEAVFTVWSNVFERGNLRPEETLLVHGGAGGIGITAVQLASLLGSRVWVTVGSDEKGKECLSLGAEKFVNYKIQDFETELKIPGADVVLDVVGAPYLEKNLSVLRPDGRLVYINAVGGDKGTFGIHALMQKRLTITGSTLRAREYAFKKRLAQAVLVNVWPLVSSGRFRPIIWKIFPAAEAAKAHEAMEQGDHIGKLVLDWENN